MIRFFVAFGLVGFFSCNQIQSNPNNWASEYFETLSKREDSAKFYSYYADDFYYENLIFEQNAQSPKELVEIQYDWFNPNYHFDSDETLEVQTITTNDSTVIGGGYLRAYQYNGRPVNAIQFLIVLELDEEGKIKKQTDWFNYSMQDIIEAQQIRNSLNLE